MTFATNSTATTRSSIRYTIDLDDSWRKKFQPIRVKLSWLHNVLVSNPFVFFECQLAVVLVVKLLNTLQLRRQNLELLKRVLQIYHAITHKLLYMTDTTFCSRVEIMSRKSIYSRLFLAYIPIQMFCWCLLAGRSSWRRSEECHEVGRRSKCCTRLERCDTATVPSPANYSGTNNVQVVKKAKNRRTCSIPTFSSISMFLMRFSIQWATTHWKKHKFHLSITTTKLRLKLNWVAIGRTNERLRKTTKKEGKEVGNEPTAVHICRNRLRNRHKKLMKMLFTEGLFEFTLQHRQINMFILKKSLSYMHVKGQSCLASFLHSACAKWWTPDTSDLDQGSSSILATGQPPRTRSTLCH